MVLIPDRDYEDRFILEAFSGTKHCWVTPTWGGQSKDQWWKLPDGADVAPIIDAAKWDLLSEPALHVDNTGVLTDMVHNSGMFPPIVSEAFADQLREAGATGFRFVPAPVIPKRGSPVHGHGLLHLDNGDADDVRGFPDRRSTALLDVAAATLDKLTAAGIKGFRARPAMQVVEEFRSIPDGP